MKVTLREVVLSMPFVFEATAYDADSDEKFQAHGIIEKGSENERIMKEAISAEAVNTYGDATKAAAKLKAIQAAGKIWCLRDGDGKLNKNGEPLAGYQGKLYVSAKNTLRPTIIGSGPEGKGPVTMQDGLMYAGAIVNMIVDVRVNNKPSDQAYAYLQGIQFVRHGERLAGGGVASADDFPAIKREEKAAAEASGEGAKSLF